MKNLLILLALLMASPAFAAGHYAGGNISNISSVEAGMLIMLSNGIPDNCAGSPAGWMLIKEENKTMVSTTLAMWASGKNGATVYTSGISAGSSFCIVTQVDPVQ